MKKECYACMPDANCDNKKAKQKVEVEDVENEIVESDLEFDGEVIEPDNDPPQKVASKEILYSLI